MIVRWLMLAPMARKLACIGVMEERVLTTLIFGNVVLEAQLLGSELRIYGDNQRSYYTTINRSVSTRVPLDDIRGNISQNHASALAGRLLNPAISELDKSYPGGSSKAINELTQWLLENND